MNKLLKLLKWLFFIVITLLLFVVTFPKENLYYKLEEVLKEHDIIVYDETTINGINHLSVQNGIINYKDIDGATFEAISLNVNIFYNAIIVKNLKANKSIQNMIPTNLQSVQIEHFLWNPFNVNIKAKALLGNISGNINLLTRTLNIQLEPTKNLSSNEKMLLKFMKYKTLPNSKKGVYSYEYIY